MSSSLLFHSFWWAGFESACHVTRAGHRLDMLAVTQHDRVVADDYARLAEVQIRTVRDTMRWHLIEATPRVFDFSSVDAFVAAAEAHGIQIVWDLLHYGVPDHVDILAPDFPGRFADFAHAAARHLAARTTAVPVYTPINEISFHAWAAGEVGWFHPCGVGQGAIVKRQLVRAWIAAVDAIRAVSPAARFVSVEPLIHVVPPRAQLDHDGRAAAMRASQFEAWDMMLGRQQPELGGGSAYLDVVGVNFYHDNQWEEPGGIKLHWHILPRDPRWAPFHVLVSEVSHRYGRPIVISETSHVGVGRAEWIREMTDEVALAQAAGVPIEGVCLYPILDRCDWENPLHWHNSGLWDVVHEADGTLRRVINAEYAAMLRTCQHRLAYRA